MLQFSRQLGGDDRGQPLAMLGEINDLAARSVMRRIRHLARHFFERNLTHLSHCTPALLSRLGTAVSLPEAAGHGT